MDKKWRRLLSLAIALVLAVTSLHLAAFAGEADENDGAIDGDSIVDDNEERGEDPAGAEDDKDKPNDPPDDKLDGEDEGEEEPEDDETGKEEPQDSTVAPEEPDLTRQSMLQPVDGSLLSAATAGDYEELKAFFEDTTDTVVRITDGFSFAGTLTVDRDITLVADSEVTLAAAAGMRHFRIDGGAIELSFRNVVLDGGEEGGGIEVLSADSLAIDGARIQNCAHNGGSAIRAFFSGSLALTGCTFAGNTATTNDGGAVLVEGASTVTIDGKTIFRGNEALANGGALYLNRVGNAEIAADFLQNSNRSTWSGGAIYAQGVDALRIAGGRYAGNTADGRGGAIAARATALAVEGAVFSGNESDIAGGAICAENGGSLRIASSEFDNNKAHGASGGGGGVYFSALDQAEIAQSNFTDNHAVFSGAAVYGLRTDSISLDGGRYAENRTGKNGAVAFEQDIAVVRIADGVFTTNTASENGAAINLFSNVYEVEITGVTVTGNTSANGNGAIDYETRSNGKFTLRDSLVADNTAGARGGGLFLNIHGDGNVGDSLVAGTTFRGNHAVRDGGGIMICNTFITVKNSDIAGNSTDRDGGGIALEKGGDHVIIGDAQDTGTERVNIEDNTAAGDGGGLYIPHERVAAAIVYRDVVFQNNKASNFALDLRPGDEDIHQAQVLTDQFTCKPHSDEMFDYAYNNFDINYTKDIIPPDVWRVSFVGNGGAIAEAGGKSHYAVYVNPDVTKLIAEPGVTKPGSTFLGWYLDDVDGSRWDFETGEVENHMILYAHWDTDEVPGGGGNGGGNTGGNNGGEYHPGRTTPTYTIPDNDVPLAELPALTEILDDDVPLGSLPKTGGTAKKGAGLLSAALAMIAAGIGLRGKDDEA